MFVLLLLQKTHRRRAICHLSFFAPLLPPELPKLISPLEHPEPIIAELILVRRRCPARSLGAGAAEAEEHHHMPALLTSVLVRHRASCFVPRMAPADAWDF